MDASIAGINAGYNGRADGGLDVCFKVRYNEPERMEAGKQVKQEKQET